MTTKCDAVVVGAGAMGRAAAWWLARAGRSVVVLEQFGPNHSRGSSHGQTRIFRVAYRSAPYVSLAREALDDWRLLEAETGCELLQTTGGVDHGAPAAVAEIEVNLRAMGVACEAMTPAAAAEQFPAMRFEGSVLLQPDAGRCLADATLDALLDANRVLGVDFHFDEPVVALDTTADGAVVTTAAGRYEAPVVIVTAGAWVAPLLKGLVELPTVTPTLEQPAHFRVLDPSPQPFPSFLHHRSVDDSPLTFGSYGLATPDGRFVKVGGHDRGLLVNPDDGPFAVDQDRLDELAEYAERWLPGVDPEPIDPIRCLYTNTPEGHFVIDRIGSVVVGSPCSGHGFKFVPAVGRRLAELAMNGGRGDDLFRIP